MNRKFWQVILEVAIVTFGVSLSIAFYVWSEHHRTQTDVHDFLAGLTEDLQKDTALLRQNREAISSQILHFSYLVDLRYQHPLPPDSVINRHLTFDLPVTHFNVGRYDGFKSSGKIDAIPDDSLKENILVFYEQTIPNLAYDESIANMLQQQLLNFYLDEIDLSPPHVFVMTQKAQSLAYLCVHNLGNSVKQYSEASRQAAKIMKEIEAELK